MTKAQINYDVYDSKKVSNLRGFACNNSIQILVINIDSFAKTKTSSTSPMTSLLEKMPVEFIKAQTRL